MWRLGAAPLPETEPPQTRTASTGAPTGALPAAGRRAQYGLCVRARSVRGDTLPRVRVVPPAAREALCARPGSACRRGLRHQPATPDCALCGRPERSLVGCLPSLGAPRAVCTPPPPPQLLVPGRVAVSRTSVCFHTVFVPGCGQQRRRGGANGAGGGRRPRTGRGGGWCRVPAARPVPIALHVPANRSPAGCAAPPALPPCSATPRTCSGRGGPGRGGPRAQACAGPGCSPRAGAFPRAGRGAAGRGGGCPLPGCSGDQAASSGEGGVPRRGGAVLAEEAGLPCVKPSPPRPFPGGLGACGVAEGRVFPSPPRSPPECTRRCVEGAGGSGQELVL